METIETTVVHLSSPTEISPAEKNQTRESIKQHVRLYESTLMDLGRMLWLVQSGKWYQDWGYDSLEDYVDKELGFALRKARYHISVWECFGVKLGIDQTVIQEIGWVKAGLLAPVVTADNVGAWIDRAKSTSAAKLQEEIRRCRELTSKADQLPLVLATPTGAPAEPESEQAEWAPEDSPASPGDIVSTSDVVHVDRKTQTAPSAASSSPPDDRVAAVMKFPLFDAQYKVVLRALEAAAVMTGSSSRSHQLDTICSVFLSGIPTDDFSKESTLSWLAERIRENFGKSVLFLPDSLTQSFEIAAYLRRTADTISSVDAEENGSQPG